MTDHPVEECTPACFESQGLTVLAKAGCTDADLGDIVRQLDGLMSSPSSLPLGEMAIAVGYEEMRGFLARLEAAEKCLDWCAGACKAHEPCPYHSEMYERWRKAAGK